jgi:hypothetical protein
VGRPKAKGKTVEGAPVSITEVVFVIIAALFLIVLARWVLQWIFGHTLHDILTDHDNPAIGLAVAGYLFAVIWTITVLLGAPSRGLWRDILDVLLYGGVGIILLTAVALVSCRFFLGLHVREQLEAHNWQRRLLWLGCMWPQV